MVNAVSGGAFLTLPTALFFLLVVKQLIGIKRGWWYRVILFLCCTVVAGIPVYIGDALNIMLVFPVFVGGIWICCCGSGTAKASIALLLYPIAMSVSAVVDTALLNATLLRGVIKLFLWLCIWLIVWRIMPKETAKLRPHLWVLIDILATLPFLTVLCIVALNDYRENLNTSQWILLPYSVIVSIALLFTVVMLSKEEKTEQENRLYQIRHLYYENLEREQWQVRRLRHDMANHLQTIAALDESSASSYLRDLINSPGMNTTKRYCEHEVANTVLSSKASHMEAQQILFECRADIPTEFAMNSIDLCALLANSLDNAMEACAKLSADRRKICLNAAVSKGLFVFTVKNSSPAPLKSRSGQIISDKRDKMRHGFGLSGIKEIVQRYGGTLVYGYQDAYFTLILSILIQKNGPTT